ncbi:DUF1236 domain-containing protein [Rhodopseudomonas sp. NSM]|uniref:DUF1236 domain-containing protein n=1 Tax=Rhodopseudomonas sp. NSM TaxID=3457630 RepID=UPI0040353BF7
MKNYLSMVLAGSMLVGGATVAAADSMSKSENRADNMSQTTVGSTAKGGRLTLSDEQKRQLWSRISEGAREQDAPDGFKGKVGETVPSGIRIERLPQQAQQDVPIVRNYRYAMLDDKIVLVNPNNDRVAGVIREQ